MLMCIPFSSYAIAYNNSDFWREFFPPVSGTPRADAEARGVLPAQDVDRSRGAPRRPLHVGVDRRTGRRHDGRSAKFRQNVARFWLYRHRFLQENTRFAAFFKIYQII